jgi:site-specific recombinase XerD
MRDPSIPVNSCAATSEVALKASAEELDDHAKAESTKAAYARAWDSYVAWCAATERNPLPASEDTLMAYVAALNIEGRAVSTVGVRLAGIRHHHIAAGHEYAGSDALKQALRGYSRHRGRAAGRQAHAMRVSDLRRIVGGLDLDRTADLRDRAIILLGFAGGFRRSELAAVEVAHVEPHDRGLRVLVPRSKSDQDGAGYRKTVPFGDHPATCPVVAYREWVARAQIASGRVFRAVNKAGNVWGEGLTDQVIADVVDRRARAVGLTLDPALKQTWSGHSLRRGMATEAVEHGAPAHKVRQQGGWRGPVPLAYFDEGEAWDDPAAGRLGL